MSDYHASRKVRGPSMFWRLYMFSWAFVAGGALMYLMVFALNPELGAKFLPTPPPSDQESNRAELDRAQLTAQVRSLSETVAVLRSDLAKVRQSQTAAPEQRQEFAASGLADDATSETPSNPISTSSINTPQIVNRATPEPGSADAEAIVRPTETAQAQPATALPEIVPAKEKPPEPAKPALKPRGPNLATSPLRAGRVPPLPNVFREQRNLRRQAAIAPPASESTGPYQSIVLNNATQATTNAAARSLPTNPIRTGTLPRPSTPAAPAAIPRSPAVSSFGQPTVNPRPAVAATSAALALSSATSVTGLKASWLLLTSRHPDAFVGYQPRYTADPARGTYRLLAGPVSSRAQADRVCTTLRARDVNCGVTEFTGQPL